MQINLASRTSPFTLWLERLEIFYKKNHLYKKNNFHIWFILPNKDIELQSLLSDKEVSNFIATEDKRFIKEEFDVDSKVLWLPDVFGYSAALPQIMQNLEVAVFSLPQFWQKIFSSIIPLQR